MNKFIYTVKFSDEGFRTMREALVKQYGADSKEYSREHIVYNQLFIELLSILQKNGASGFLTCQQVKEDGSLEMSQSDIF